MDQEVMVVNGDIMPQGVETVKQRYGRIASFYETVMIPEVDYMVIPGTSGKPSLLKSGAEKLAALFRFTVDFEYEEKEEDWDGSRHGGEPFFYYRVCCRVFSGGIQVGEGKGSINSWESRYRYRWVSKGDIPFEQRNDELATRTAVYKVADWQLKKSETTGPYAKPVEYWQMFHDAIAAGDFEEYYEEGYKGRQQRIFVVTSVAYRVTNPDIYSQVNTLLKMGMKRAYVDAILRTTGVGAFFTQDVEDLPGFGYSEDELVQQAVVAEKAKEAANVKTEEQAPSQAKPERQTAAPSSRHPRETLPKHDPTKPWFTTSAYQEYLDEGAAAHGMSPREISSQLHAPDYKTKEEALIALADKLDQEKAGETHWSEDARVMEILRKNIDLTYKIAPSDGIKLVDLKDFDTMDSALEAVGLALDEQR